MSETLLSHIKKNPHDQKCFDCSSSLKKPIASLNNAIYICQSCAETHNTLGKNISHTKALSSPNWFFKKEKRRRRENASRWKSETLRVFERLLFAGQGSSYEIQIKRMRIVQKKRDIISWIKN